MFNLLLVIHLFICVALIIVVLMQSSKGEGLAGAFGGGSITGAVFGGRGAASFLSKSTTILAILFMISCLGLSVMSSGTRSATQETGTPKSAVSTAVQKEVAAQQAQQQQQPAANPTGQTQQGTTQNAANLLDQPTTTAKPGDSAK